MEVFLGRSEFFRFQLVSVEKKPLPKMHDGFAGKMFTIFSIGNISTHGNVGSFFSSRFLMLNMLVLRRVMLFCFPNTGEIFVWEKLLEMNYCWWFRNPAITG